MISLKKKQQGFTIIELVIVIIVIGILATIAFVAYRGVTQDARNSQRESDISQLNSLLEYYYGQNSNYPTLANLNDSTWRSANLQIDDEILTDPQGTATLVGAPAAGSYSYQATPSGCDNSTTMCTGYTITATYEGGGTFVKESVQ